MTEVEKLRALLAEARAEVERLREAGAWMDEVVRKAACAVAYRRGAEAMREAAVLEIERQVDAPMMRAGLAADIRDLPVPEDKP